MKLRPALRGEWSAVAVCAVVFGLFSYLQPHWQDVLCFTADFHRYCDEEGGATMRAFLRYFQFETTVDNGRLFNRLSPLMMDYVPKWLDATLLAGMMALLYWCAGKLIGLRRSDGTLWWLALIVMFFVLPWNNNILVPVYSLNYIYPAACALAAVYLSLRPSVWSPVLECTASVDAPWRVPTNTGRVGTRHGASTEAKVTFDILAVVFGILAAWGHEGIGGILIAGAVPMMLCCRQFGRYKLLYIVSTLATVVAMVAFFTTTMTQRLVGELAKPWICSDPATCLFFNGLSALLLVAAVACCCRKNWRRWLVAFVGKTPLSVYFFGLAMAGMVVSAITSRAYRTSFWPQLCALLVWSMVLLPLLRRYIRWLRPAAWCLGMLCALLVVGEVYVSAQYRKSYDDACRQLDNPECNTAYIKILLPRQFPALISRFAPRYIFMDYMQVKFMRQYRGSTKAIVPEALRAVDTSIPSDSIVVLPGGYGYFRPSRDDGAICSNTPGNITTAEGIRYNEPLYMIDFLATDGTSMIWVQPLYVLPEDVVDIELDFDQFYPRQ